ncbi:MerR family transcriptional regulator [Glycomyces tenuis]|uniref:MerR family transcriptional regulator n=1 Tax=Glycomyces tenuis TaxID=58116 RepID=UPI00047A7269|nr:MerR family transcriptional regulator [Glycomyces tenuis]
MPAYESAASEGLTVGQAAALVGVSVKTLHHWDEIGLVRPGSRTTAGYRVYSGEDIARVHRVLVYRELGFELAAIGRLLDDPDVDAREHLRRQRSQLLERIGRLEHMVGAVDRMLDASRRGLLLTPREQVEIFGDQWRPEWAEEAERRWGDTAQWRQYAERAATMSPLDWKGHAADVDALNAELAAAVRAGLAPGSERAAALAERHRRQLSAYFDCTHSMHVCIGRRYVDEAGFAEYYDAMAPGLTRWLRDAIFANARAHGVDPETAVWE